MSARRKGPVRAGLSLIEILVALTLLGIIGMSILRTFTSQARLADLQVKRLDARAVSRAPVNLLMSEARMVETGSGVVAVARARFTYSVSARAYVVDGVTMSWTRL